MCALATGSRVELVQDRQVDDAHDGLLVDGHADADARIGEVVDEVVRPVHWVDDPRRVVRHLVAVAFLGRGFFANELVRRVDLPQARKDGFLDVPVDGRHAVGFVPLFVLSREGRPAGELAPAMEPVLEGWADFLGEAYCPLAALPAAALGRIPDSELAKAQRQLDSDLTWGTYRPNLYFGTRPRLPNSLLSGLMWFGLDNPRNWQSIRHSCELGDNLEEYGYSRHNGRDFGEQMMRDSDQGVEIKSEFIKVPGKRGGSWAVRFSGTTLNDDTQGVSLVYYFGLEGNGTMSMDIDGGMAKIKGKAPGLGRFNIRVVPAVENQHPPVPKQLSNIKGIPTDKRISGMALSTPRTEIWRAKDIFQDRLLTSARARAEIIGEHTKGQGPMAGSLLFGLSDIGLGSAGNDLFFVQMVVHGRFAFDVVYECSDKTARIDSDAISAIASNKRKEFDGRFETTFGLREKGFSKEQTEMARNALSNLVGGIGYFYGSGLVSRDPKPEYGEKKAIAEPELSEPYSLFATTPSRPFFPRGFLWDEGFHQLVLGHWDGDLSLEILKSWYGAMDQGGWIAREQILGEEARSKVPSEFQVQYPNFANPPTLAFAVEAAIERFKAAHSMKNTHDGSVYFDGVGDSTTPPEAALRHRILGELSTNASRVLTFFENTQGGDVQETAHKGDVAARGYRWRGRTENHTLTCGLDDYPRAFPPSKSELHVDLLSWVAYLTRFSMEAGSFGPIGEPPTADFVDLGSSGEKKPKGDPLQRLLQTLDDVHWNDDRKMYCDVTTRVREDYDELEDDETDARETVFVCHKGYVSLFPMLLGLLQPDSDKLGHILDMIEDPEELWTDYGIRSLSKSDELYGKGENYWRGPIWININYLILSSLHKNYISVEGPHKEQALRIYKSLRSNLVRNVFRVYQDTRFFWEQYNPEGGKGQRTHPFTGWTTLILPIMAEMY
ncbi:glycoside hydrolase [Martensiomyces pterosporus]|nr:glycoside hydrolase [Martensiomyces pterosporus]